MAAEAKGGIIGASVAALVALALLLMLGTWQLQRLQWKEAVIARIEQRIGQPAIPVPSPSEWPTLDVGALEYRPLTATGRFDHAREVRIYTLLSEPRGPLRGPGYNIMTPLVMADGGTVLVNRGFVPADRLDPASRGDGQVEGEVTVTGLGRLAEEPGMFTPDTDPEKRVYHARDLTRIAADMGLSNVAPFSIDADSTPNPGGLPQGGETRLVIPNRHLEYAITWYGLAGSLLAVYAAWLWQRRRQKAERSF